MSHDLTTNNHLKTIYILGKVRIYVNETPCVFTKFNGNARQMASRNVELKSSSKFANFEHSGHP